MIFDKIPLPPTSNHMYATFQGRRIKSRELLAWEKSFMQWAYLFRTSLRSVAISLHGQEYALKIDTWFHFSRSSIFCKDGKPKRIDSSNRIKAIHDQIAKALSIDDCYFFDGSFFKRVTQEGAQERCTVYLFKMEIPKAPMTDEIPREYSQWVSENH